MGQNSDCLFPPGTPLVVYLRHSPGEDQTIASQRTAVRQWCAEHDLVIVEEFVDEAKSGASTSGREEFTRMIEWLQNAKREHPVTSVVVWSFSRFGRNYNDVQYYKSLLRRIGIDVFSMTEAIPRESVGHVIEAMHDWKSEEDLIRLSKDVKRGLRILGEQGYSIGGFAPIGYRKSAPVEIGRRKNGTPRLAHKWEIDNAIQDRVAQAWKMKLEGCNHRDIHRATHLCASPRGYSDLFKNETYTGLRKCGELRVEGAHPTHISHQDFERIQLLRQPNRARVRRASDTSDHPARRKSGNGYLLFGILKCGYCNWSMVGNGNGDKAYYRCDWRHRAGHESCQQPSIVAYVLHDLVCDWMAMQVLTFDRLASLREQFDAALSGTQHTAKDELVTLNEKYTRVDKQISNLLNALERGGWSEEVQRRLEERKREKAQCESERATLEQKMQLGRLKISDQVLRHLSEDMKQAWYSVTQSMRGN